MTHTENNTKIAKFLGYGITDGHQGKGIIRNGEHISINKLKFHSDWNWLIEAIDAITSHESYAGFIDFSSSMVDSGGIHINTRFIKNTYEDVIYFVEWYNKNGIKENNK